MEKQRLISFDVFTLDVANESLWRGSERIHLRPKTFAFLQYLAARPGQMLTKEHLLSILWKDCYVGDGALKTCVAEIRKQLGDSAEAPKIIETAHRRGYRFIAKTGPSSPAFAVQETHFSRSDRGPIIDTGKLVGRTSELAQLRQHLEIAMSGTRQVVFVTGEQGIGKTALVDTFLKMANPGLQVKNSSQDPKGLWIVRGQCIKSHGAREAYMPIREAFTGLCHEAGQKRVADILRRHAPLWLLQMPSLVSPEQLRKLKRATLGAPREQLMREMTEALEALTTDTPLILVLEDLHWSDHATLDLILYWAQRRFPARLLLLGTYRSAEAIDDDHLKTVTQELQAHNLCRNLPLALLSTDIVSEYLTQRFPNHMLPAETAKWIHRRTEGNPLFVVNLVDHLIAAGFIEQHNKHCMLKTTLDKAELDVPPTIQQIIERQIGSCSIQEQRLLQAASVVGVDFSVAAVAAALGEEADQIEKQCRGLVHRHLFLHPAKIHQPPGGKREAGYRFNHVLYQNICYQTLPEEFRAQLHRQVAEYIERTNENQRSISAARLAMHFEQGQDYDRAIKYYQQAAANANWRYMGREAKELAERGIQLLGEVSNGLDRSNIEMSLQIELGTALVATRGLGTPEVKRAFNRALELLPPLDKQGQSGNNNLLFSALWGLWNHSWIQAEYAAARETAERLFQLAQNEQDTTMLNQAHFALGIIMMDHGEFADALRHLEQCPTVISRVYAALTMWNLGFPNRSVKSLDETLAHAFTTQNPEDCIFTNVAMARVYAARRENEKALDHAQTALNLARQNNFLELWLAPWKIILGWAQVKLGRVNEGIEQIRQAIAEHQGIGITNITPYLLAMFAESLGDAGKTEEGLIVIQEARDAVHKTGMSYYEAEIYRLEGELLLQRIKSEEKTGSDNRKFSNIESCFKTSIRIARQQQAKSFELRATTSLAKLLQRQNRREEARECLVHIYSRFTEGQDTSDLQDAHELIQALS
jgi:DNA-binding winged helix-turn-helix (wHTH) protein/tetratricopeptide (TPR) repeat protein